MSINDKKAIDVRSEQEFNKGTIPNSISMPLLNDDQHKLVGIEYKKNVACSKHKHEFKWNGFFVESGKMKVLVWQNDYSLVDETILNPGEFMRVKPGVYHQFIGMEDGVAFELYWAEFDHNDIKRESVGQHVNG